MKIKIALNGRRAGALGITYPIGTAGRDSALGDVATGACAATCCSSAGSGAAPGTRAVRAVNCGGCKTDQP